VTLITRLYVPFAIIASASTAHAEWLWTRLDKPSPPSMYGHSMVYDSLRDRLILYGGTRFYTESQGNHIHPYVWEWDGEPWNKIRGSVLFLQSNLALGPWPVDFRLQGLFG